MNNPAIDKCGKYNIKNIKIALNNIEEIIIGLRRPILSENQPTIGDEIAQPMNIKLIPLAAISSEKP